MYIPDCAGGIQYGVYEAVYEIPCMDGDHIDRNAGKFHSLLAVWFLYRTSFCTHYRDGTGFVATLVLLKYSMAVVMAITLCIAIAEIVLSIWLYKLVKGNGRMG